MAVAFAALSFVTVGIGQAAELRSIEDVLSEEASDAMVSYMAMRCTAAYMAVADQFEIDAGAQVEKEVAGFRQAAS